MGYFYHRVVENMQGTILYPLNQLKDIYPDVYKKHLEKYEGREEVLESRIPPPLDCLWNDVLHFTAVPPQVLFNNLQEAGFSAEEIVWKRWFKVPIESLDPENITVCLYRRDISPIPKARDFHLYDPKKVAEYRTVPPETKEYYREQQGLGKQPLFFHRVPHILFKGTIDTWGIEVIDAF